MLPPKKAKGKVDFGAAKEIPELSPKEKDGIWMKLIVLFSNHSFINLTMQGINMLNTQETKEVNLIFSSIEFLK